MIKRLKNKKAYKVYCVWCGTKIRDAKEEDAKGICLTCFYQRLTKHFGNQKRSRYGEFVSDR